VKISPGLAQFIGPKGFPLVTHRGPGAFPKKFTPDPEWVEKQKSRSQTPEDIRAVKSSSTDTLESDSSSVPGEADGIPTIRVAEEIPRVKEEEEIHSVQTDLPQNDTVSTNKAEFNGDMAEEKVEMVKEENKADANREENNPNSYEKDKVEENVEENVEKENVEMKIRETVGEKVEFHEDAEGIKVEENVEDEVQTVKEEVQTVEEATEEKFKESGVCSDAQNVEETDNCD
jgi:hypothetical protein